MATVIEQLTIEYDFSNYNWEEMDRLEKEAVENAREKLSCDEFVGEIIRFQIADGYAQYLIKSKSPLQLIHLGFGDSYQALPATIRGLNKSDIKEMLRRSKALAKMFGN